MAQMIADRGRDAEESTRSTMIEVAIDGAVAHATLKRPGVNNALIAYIEISDIGDVACGA
jgi:hypothetical protein